MNVTKRLNLIGNFSGQDVHNGTYDEKGLVEIYTEDYNIWIKIVFVILGVISLFTSVLALVVMRRTKKIPYAARFLSKGLLIFDVLFITTCSIRKFIMEPFWNLNLQVASSVCLQLSYITVGLMALERLLVFNWPIFYLNNCSHRTVRKTAISVWTICVCIFLTVRYLGCYLKYKSNIMLIQAGLCTKMVSIYYGFILAVVLAMSIFCYCKIFRIVQNTSKEGTKRLSFFSTAKVIKTYKSTCLVLVYLLVIIITSVAYIIIMIIQLRFLVVTQLRISLEIVTIINCFLDPYLYVLWFRESQMECLKIIFPWNKSVREKVEQMRTEIYDIVTTTVSKHTSRVAPELCETAITDPN